MYVVRFASYRVVEYSDPHLFQSQVGKWMENREAENSYLLGRLPSIVTQARQTGILRDRLFALQDRDTIMAAGILFDGGCFVHTWATREMLGPWVDGLMECKVAMSSVLGPAHFSWQLAQSWAERTKQKWEIGRAERIYQVARVTYASPTTGRLELATEGERANLVPWMEGFVQEAEYEAAKGKYPQMVMELVRDKALYLWKEPEAVSMAAWTAPTAHGASINFVYTPPELRGKGYGKAVVSALANRMLASGLAYCFLLTDTNDERLHRLYQAVGARTVCELARCTISQGISNPPGPSSNGGGIISR